MRTRDQWAFLSGMGWNGPGYVFKPPRMVRDGRVRGFRFLVILLEGSIKYRNGNGVG